MIKPSKIKGLMELTLQTSQDPEAQPGAAVGPDPGLLHAGWQKVHDTIIES